MINDVFIFFLAFLSLIKTNAYSQAVNISLVDSFIIVDKPDKDILNFHVIPFEEGVLVEYIESRTGCRVKISDSLLYFNIKDSQQFHLYTPKDFHLYSRFNIMDFKAFLSIQDFKLVCFTTIGKILRPLNIIGGRRILGTYRMEKDTLKIRPLKKSNWIDDIYEWNKQEVIIRFSNNDHFFYKGFIKANDKLKLKKFIDLKKLIPELDIKQATSTNYIKDKNWILVNYTFRPQSFCFDLENKKYFAVDYKEFEYNSSKNTQYYSKIGYTRFLDTDWYYQLVNNNDNSHTLIIWKTDLNHHYDAIYRLVNEYPLLINQDKLYTYLYADSKLILKKYNLFQ